MKKSILLFLSACIISGCAADTPVETTTTAATTAPETTTVTTTEQGEFVISAEELEPMLSDNEKNIAYCTPSKAKLITEVAHEINKDEIMAQISYDIPVEISESDYNYAVKLLEEYGNETLKEQIPAQNYFSAYPFFVYMGTEYADWFCVVNYYAFSDVVPNHYYTSMFYIKDGKLTEELSIDGVMYSTNDIIITDGKVYFPARGIYELDKATGQLTKIVECEETARLINITENYIFLWRSKGRNNLEIYDRKSGEFIVTPIYYSLQDRIPYHFSNDTIIYRPNTNEYREFNIKTGTDKKIEMKHSEFNKPGYPWTWIDSDYNENYFVTEIKNNSITVKFRKENSEKCYDVSEIAGGQELMGGWLHDSMLYVRLGDEGMLALDLENDKCGAVETGVPIEQIDWLRDHGDNAFVFTDYTKYSALVINFEN